ncbi:MAG: DNA alkylation repair protein [Thaumarchaeota archaeon]|nr:DNA alkylation repair protein [Nitrososphaerota archaeon]MCL5317088.1 DNA alkylation repair protein [Nitrososphaerota archaeon]
MELDEVLRRLRLLYNPRNVEGMGRFGINTNNTYGVTIPDLRKIAKEIGKDHHLAQRLWDSQIHEARILASMVDEPKKVTEEQMERWVRDFDSWDVCDQCCMNLFEKTSYPHQKAVEWSNRKEEFVKRAGFVLMARLAVTDKKAGDSEFLKFLPLIMSGATDDRNYVKKAVNWALRQIGKRNVVLNEAAINTANEIQAMNSKAAKWVASDALRELTSKNIQKK